MLARFNLSELQARRLPYFLLISLLIKSIAPPCSIQSVYVQLLAKIETSRYMMHFFALRLVLQPDVLLPQMLSVENRYFQSLWYLAKEHN
jgi:hypothetical protein